MVTLTGLRPDLHRSGYLVLFVDGERYASLPAAVVRALEIEPDAALSETTKARLDEAAADEAAYRAAQASLACRPRARHDLIRRLVARGHGRAAAGRAADRLEAAGALDDRRYASLFASVRLDKGHGRSRVLRDLLSAGVERSVADRGIDDALADGADPVAEIRGQLERRAAHMGGLDRIARRRRLLAFLERRGHWGSEARQLVDEVIDG